MVSFLEKINIILRLMRVFKNWYIFPSIYLKLTKNETVIFETKKGTKMKIRVNSTDLMALINVWAVEEYSNEEFKIKNNDTVIDIGGHIGLFSLYASEKCKSGKIFTFEPVKENFDLLKENIKINNAIKITFISTDGLAKFSTGPIRSNKKLISQITPEANETPAMPERIVSVKDS